MRRRVIFSLIMGGLLAAALALTRAPLSAQDVPDPCDFITGGGFIFTDDDARANFGAHGGCKNGEFWGHVNYVDHGGFMGQTPYHVDSTEITGYVTVDGSPNARDICGFARTNAGETNVAFRVRMEDNTATGGTDRFDIRLSNSYIVTTRFLGGGGSDGGNVTLHKNNPSTTAPDTALDCGPEDEEPPHF